MKTIIFFSEYSFVEAGIATLTYKESGLFTKKIRWISEYGLKNPVYEASLPNLWSSYSACKYGGVRSTGRETKNPDSLKSFLELLGNQDLK